MPACRSADSFIWKGVVRHETIRTQYRSSSRCAGGQPQRRRQSRTLRAASVAIAAGAARRREINTLAKTVARTKIYYAVTDTTCSLSSGSRRMPPRSTKPVLPPTNGAIRFITRWRRLAFRSTTYSQSAKAESPRVSASINSLETLKGKGKKMTMQMIPQNITDSGRQIVSNCVPKKEETIILVRHREVCAIKVKRPLMIGMAYYFIWECECKTTNITHHSNPDLLLCDGFSKQKRDTSEVAPVNHVVLSLKEFAQRRSRVEWCRSCSRSYFALTDNRSRAFCGPNMERE